jgi:hypothetical protein
MKRTSWIHTLLHLGCVALLLVQGYRIRQIQKVATADHAGMEQKLEGVRFFEDETKERLDSCYNVIYPGYLRKQAEVTKK